MTAHPLPDSVIVRDSHLAGVEVVEVSTATGDLESVVLYLHGGAFAMGSAKSSAALVAEIVQRIEVRVLSVDYGLAPEHPFPAGLDDAVNAYQTLLAQGTAPHRIVLAGESAGGGLALALMVHLREHQLPMPAAALVMSPWADLSMTSATLQSKADVDPALTESGLRVRAADYLGPHDPKDPLASPALADLRALPPLLIQVGSHEVLLGDALKLAIQAATDDVAVTLEVTPGMPHVFQGFAAILDEGAAALDSAARFIRAALHPHQEN